MRRIKTSLFYLQFLILALILSFSFVTPLETLADDITVCTVTPDRVDGQGFNVSSLGFNVSSLGFNVSSLGFNVSSLGFNVSSLGFNVSSLGFNVSSLEDIINQLLTEVTPAWLLDPFETLNGGIGYNTHHVDILVVDDFTSDNAHGVKVLNTIQWLVDNLPVDPETGPLDITVHAVDIATSDVNFEAEKVAGKIAAAVNSLDPNAHVVLNMSFGLVPCDDPTDVTLTDGESGSSFTVNNDFGFDDYINTAEGIANGTIQRPFEPLTPFLECVVPYGSKGITAYFGYVNPNPYTVEITDFSQNKLAPTPIDGAQPYQFAPKAFGNEGVYHYVFSVSRDNGNITWKLGNKTAVAGKHSPKCQGEIPEPSSQIFPQGYGMGNYFNEVMGIPPQFVDEYFDYLFGMAEEDEDDTDPFANIKVLLKSYGIRSYIEANDEDPSTNFALIPVASAGNFRHLFNTTGDPYAPVFPLKPASYPEAIATSARVGDYGTFWPFSHDGNVEAPGISIFLETAIEDGEVVVTELGAGTSFSAPFMSVLSGIWLTYPDACEFNADGTPPLVPEAESKTGNAQFNLTTTPLDCGFNFPPEFEVEYTNLIVDEGDTKFVGIVTDPDNDSISLSVSENSAGITIDSYDAETGEFSISVGDGLNPAIATPVTITATDASGSEATIGLVITILNVEPIADLSVSPEIVGISENVTLTMTLVDEPSDADISAGFSYEYDCDISDESPPVSTNFDTYGCAYEEAGTYDVSATIIDKDGGAYTADGSVTVEAGEEEPYICYAENVVLYEPGVRKNGTSIRTNRMNPNKALGAPQDNDKLNFVALGFAPAEGDPGVLIVDFGENVILNNNSSLPDVRIWETSYNDHNSKPWSKYPEAADIYGTMDGETWVYLGTTTDKDQAYDLTEGLLYATQIKIVDATNRKKFGRNADGFDVDAVEGFDCGPEPTTF